MMSGLYAVIGFLVVTATARKWWLFTRDMEQFVIPAPGRQFTVWAAFMVAFVVLSALGNVLYGVIALLLGQFVPRWRRISI
jgi:hypothetical protein